VSKSFQIPYSSPLHLGGRRNGNIWFTELALGAWFSLAISTQVAGSSWSPVSVPSDPTQQFSKNCEREGWRYLVVLRACFQSFWCTWQQTFAVVRQPLEAILTAGHSWVLYFTVIPRWWDLLHAKVGVVTNYLMVHCWNSLLFKDLTRLMSEFFTLH
jgi:hypothetical protein